jgi:hypothetical protein
MHSLLKSPGYAVAQDRVIVAALEFWNAFVELLVDAEFEDDEEPKTWVEFAKPHIMQLTHELLEKACFPSQEELTELDANTLKEFRQFRADVKELLASAHPTVGTDLTEAIARASMDSLESREWLRLEASLFCLGAVAEAERESEDVILATIFGSPLYATLSEINQAVPPRTCRTAVDLLGQFSYFFERHTQYLPAALDFLFASLSSPALAQQAARSISSLCSSCRTSLTPQLQDFFTGYERFLGFPTADMSAKEKVIGGIAAVMQAVSSKHEHMTWLVSLLTYVQHDIDGADTEFLKGDFESGQVQAWTAMRCLASVSKASQTPDDVPVNLESDGLEGPDFWRSGPGKETQTQICKLIQRVMILLQKFQHLGLELHGDILETICSIFKSGFGEAVPGPFVLPPGVIVDFVSTVQLNTPRIEVVLGMTCAFLRSYTMTSSPRIDVEAALILQHLLGIIRNLEDPSSEGEVACGILEVLTRYMPRYVNVLLQTSAVPADLEALFSFPLVCLGVPEHLPQRSATQFWVSPLALVLLLSMLTTRQAAFLALKPGITNVSQEDLDQFITQIGPKLAIALISQVSGKTMRSDLDWFAEPLKTLSTRHVQSKAWLDAALASNNIDSAVRQRFIKQLSM